LTNHSDFSFYNPDKRDFTANVPVNMNLTQGNLTARKAFVGKIELQYTPRYFYEIDKGRKQMLNSAYPSFKLTYEQGFNNVLSSTGKFHKMEFAMEQNISFGLFNNIFYQLKAGQVNITKETHFADFKHFSTNPLLFKLNAIQSDLMRSSDARFNLLDYYKSATDGYYLEGHLNYAKQLLILKYLPLLNTTSIRECLSLHYLKTNELNHYLELGYGLKNIFMVFDLDFFASFENGKHEQYGLKISVPFGKSGNINL